MSMTRQQASTRLMEVQARLYQIGQEEKALTDEARAIAGFLNLANQEDRELAKAKQEAEKAEEPTGEPADPKSEPAGEDPTAESDAPPDSDPIPAS